MNNKKPDFFENRTEAWCFEDVLSFIHLHFNVKGVFSFTVGNKVNTPGENNRAGLVLAYAQFMDYTFNQVKALFSEHDHFSIAMPESREGRNILELNNIFITLLQKGNDANIKINDFPELFDIPSDILTIKKK